MRVTRMAIGGVIGLRFQSERFRAGAISDGGGSSACLVMVADEAEAVTSQLALVDRDVRPWVRTPPGCTGWRREGQDQD
jgi:hypothetical protein